MVLIKLADTPAILQLGLQESLQKSSWKDSPGKTGRLF